MSNFLMTLQGVGAITGIVGTIAITSNRNATRLKAFCLWIISNAALLIWALNSFEIILGFFYTIYLGLSTFGLIRTWRWNEVYE